jgi:hypothetical protein
VLLLNSGTQEARVYAEDGSFLFSFGGPGQGPGEFGRLSTMRVFLFAGDSVGITDPGNGRINVYDTDGRPMRTVALTRGAGFGNVSVFGRLDAGEWLALAPVGTGMLGGAPGERIEMDHAVLLVQPSGDSSRVITVQPSSPRIVNELGGIIHYPYVPFFSNPITGTDGRSLFLVPGGASEVREYSPTGDLRASFRWESGRRAVADIWDRYRDESLAGIGDDNQRALYSDFFNEDLPLPEHLPAVQGLLVDALGSIWTERYRLPWEVDNVWDVLSSEGVWLGSFTTPSRLRVFEIGRGHILGLARDDLGVERVLSYRLHRSEGS